MRRRTQARLCGSLLVLSLAGVASGQERSAADLESARTAMADAQALRDAGNLEGALSKYKAAHAMGGTAITAYELGRCHMDLGHLLEARELLLSVARIAKNPNETARAEAARANAAALAEKLEPRIPTIVVSIAGPTPVDLTITIDGEALPIEAIGARRRVDPGAHSVVGKSRGGEAKAVQVRVAEYDAKDVTLTFDGTAAPPVADGPAESEDDKRFGVHFRFVKPPEPDVAPGEVWTLHDHDGAALCTLPCERWVRASSKAYLEVSADGTKKRVDVATTYALPTGAHVVVHPVTQRGAPGVVSTLGAIMIFPYLGGLVMGATTSIICATDSATSHGCDSLGGWTAAELELGLTVGLATAHIIWGATTRRQTLVLEEAAGVTMPAGVSLVPGAVRVTAGSARASFTPGGVTGTF